MTHASPLTYQIFDRRVLLKGHLVLTTGLHIGQGRDIGTGSTDLPVIKDRSGRPFIPGSSFKGVLRSCIESILRAMQKDTGTFMSCLPVGGIPVSDQARDQTEDCKSCPESCPRTVSDLLEGPCIPQACKENLIGKDDADFLLWEKSCWVCQCFGSPWLSSKVQISDMPVVLSTWEPELLQVRDGVAIDRESETAAERQKYNFEVVPPNTRFEFEILVENPDDRDLGMLFMGFDMINDGMALLGGNTSRGLGKVRIEIGEIEEQTPDTILENLRGKKAGPDEIDISERSISWKKVLYESIVKAREGK